jgi:hypothetical protein
MGLAAQGDSGGTVLISSNPPSGKLEIEVRGLIIPARGNNPISAFRGVVNCLRPDSPDTGVNLVTDPFPATPAGDSTIEA